MDLSLQNKGNHNTASDLHVSIYSQNYEVLSECVKNKKIINSFWRGSTAVSSALYQKRYDMLEILVENGANCNLCTRNNKMEPPLFAACRLQDQRAVAILLNSSNLDLGQQDFFGRTPIWAAARYGTVDMIELLLNSGAKLNITNPGNKVHPINAAIVGGYRRKKIFDLLVRRGSLLDSVCVMSPLKVAVAWRDIEIFSLLVSAGCKINGNWLCDNLPEEWKKNKSFCCSVQFVTKNPRSLRHLSACVIRNILIMKWDNLQEYHVKKLSLPDSLVSLLLFKKINFS